jgi:hypothetical protein
MHPIDGHHLVFVGGLHRSGTSPLYRALGTHPDVSCLANTGVPEDEGQHLQPVYPPAWQFGGAGRFGFYSGARLTEQSRLITETNRNTIFSSWSRYWNLTKPTLVEKSPPNVIRSRFLQAMFPGSSFIFITRHPVPTVLATVKWSKTSLTAAIEHWLVCHRLMIEDINHLDKKLVVKYESMVADPTGHSLLLSEYLNLHNDFNMADIRAGVNDKYFIQWERLKKSASYSRAAIAVLMNKLLYGEGAIPTNYAREIADIESRFEGAINEFGYNFRGMIADMTPHEYNVDLEKA